MRENKVMISFVVASAILLLLLLVPQGVFAAPEEGMLRHQTPSGELEITSLTDGDDSTGSLMDQGSSVIWDLYQAPINGYYLHADHNQFFMEFTNDQGTVIDAVYGSSVPSAKFTYMNLANIHSIKITNQGTSSQLYEVDVTERYVTDFISAGETHNFIIQQDGSLSSWGEHKQGRLGRELADGTISTIPVSMGADRWRSVSSTFLHSAGIKEDGTLWTWGFNYNGELGDGTNNKSSVPVQVGEASDWASVKAGKHHTVALKSDGTLWAWGENNNGQLGIDSTQDQNVPVQIGRNMDWAQIETGGTHTLAIKQDGSLWAWGSNSDGQIGNDAPTIDQTSPLRIGTDMDWMAVSGGINFSMALKQDGTLWTWGSNSNGQLGNGAVSTQLSPVQMGGDTNWTHISTNGEFSLALKQDGTLWAWGDGNRDTPVQIGSETDWINIAAGSQHAVAVKSDYSIWSWGDNSMGQLGNGSSSVIESTSPTPVLDVNTNPIHLYRTSNVLDSLHVQANFTGGNVELSWTPPEGFTWKHFNIYRHDRLEPLSSVENAGFTDDSAFISNQLYTYTVSAADSDGIEQISETVSVVADDPTAVQPQITNGEYHSLAIDTNGDLFAWGSNLKGQIGSNSATEEYYTPYLISTDTPWKKVFAGNLSSFAIKSDDTLWSWGDNFKKQLGTGPGLSYSEKSPVQISAATWYQVSSGVYHSVGIQKNGTLWSWGANESGQLGTGIDIRQYSPVQIGQENTWNQVKAVGDTTLALKADGTLWAWGGYSNLYIPHQIGTDSDWSKIINDKMVLKNDGTLWEWSSYVFSGEPTQLGSSSDWKQIASGNAHYLAVKADGTLWSWGDNTKGQLGTGSTWDVTSPEQIGTDQDWQSVSAGDMMSMAFKLNGEVYAWGNNLQGQLGINNVLDNEVYQISQVVDSDNIPFKLYTESAPPEITGIEFDQNSYVVRLTSEGLLGSFAVYANYSDGSQEVITDSVELTSDNPEQFSINLSDMTFYAREIGNYTVTANYAVTNESISMNDQSTFSVIWDERYKHSFNSAADSMGNEDGSVDLSEIMPLINDQYDMNYDQVYDLYDVKLMLDIINPIQSSETVSLH